MRINNSAILRLLVLGIAFFISPAWPQSGSYFGQNKILYKNFEWAVFRTEHFDVHYYPEEHKAAQDAARMAERGYDYLSATLNHQIKERTPLILYASLNDFQQTNVVSGLLDQGTRGVTESLKNRVVLPITGSYREFNHVLVHELVHAFQYNMMSGALASGRFNPPLWLVEGMAEYLSAGMDNTTRMWVRDGLMNNNLLTVEQLNGAFDIRVYRLGQSLWHYIGETYGKQTVGALFKSAARQNDVELAFKEILGLDSKELTARWHAFSRKLVMPADSTLHTPEQIARQITHKQGYFHHLNLVPAVSPEGDRIAYVANKNLNEDIYLLSKEPNGEWREERLLNGGASKRFETLRFFDSAIGWSRDGHQLAFISKSGKDDALYVMNANTKEVTHKLVFATLNGLQSPSFSPEGDKIVFVGISGGISDLYIAELASGKLEKLTDDRFAELHPQWSPDGLAIAFVTDRGPGTDEEKLLFGDYDLAVYHLSDKSIELITSLPGNATSPQWSRDGSAIAFISDHQGIPNIYRVELADKSITALTSLRNGVSGITETTPALSWSANGTTMVFTAFEKNSWQLYCLQTPASPAVEISRIEVNSSPIMQNILAHPTLSGEMHVNAPAADDSLWLPAIADANGIYENYALEPVEGVSQRDYSSRFKLDAVAVGGGYDTYFGAAGQATFLFTDMLGNNSLYLSSAMQFSNPLHTDLGVLYYNQGHRINYGIQAFQSNVQYAAGASQNSLTYLRNTYRGFNAIVAYPFNRFARFELFGGMTWVDQDAVQEIYGFSEVKRETIDLAVYKYAQTGAALVFDNTTYGPLGPASGSRSRFSVETTVQDFQFTNFQADYRRYFNIKHRSVLSWRLMGGSSVGRDQQIFSIGGPYSYRGADYDALAGTRFLISNLEYRFPLFPFLPANYDFFSAAAFYDAAAAWGVDIPGYSKETFQPFSSGLRLQDLKSALGLGVRFNVGYFLLQYDVAWPTDWQNFSKPVKMFSIGTYF
ncbi:MAG: peptidase MA family metallohydrolase [bacterium]